MYLSIIQVYNHKHLMKTKRYQVNVSKLQTQHIVEQND